MKHLTAATFAVIAAFGSAAAQDPEAEPTLEAITVDGLRTCQSILAGRTPDEAAVIFGFAMADAIGVRETDKGKVEVLPPDPAADRRSCRVQVSALTLENDAMVEAVKTFVTTPPQAYAPLQMRIAERLGNYAARTSIWAARNEGGVSMVTLYEILANEYYHGPKIMIDAIVEGRR